MYRLYSFDGVTLPDARSEFDGDTAQAWLGAVALPGGTRAFDSLGSGQAPLVTPYLLEYSSVVSASSLATLESTVSAWRAKTGVRGLLRRRVLSAATYQDITARLVEITMPIRPTATHGKQIKLTWRFQVLDEFWRHASKTSTSATLDSNPKTFDVVNAGNAIIRDCIFTITAGSADITAMTFNMVSGTYNWNYNGTIPAGTSIIVDAGARRVRSNAGVDQYANFVLNSGHVWEDWIGIPNGTRTVVIAKNGGSTNSTVVMEYYSKYV